MKNGLRHFRLACGVVGLLAVMTEASAPPTFSLNMAGIKKDGQSRVIFRDIVCDPNNDQCEILAGPGSKCVDTEVQQIPGFFANRCSPLDQVVEMRCVGGPTPGISCIITNDCGFRGACRRIAVPASHCVGGPTEGVHCTSDAQCGVGGACVQGSIVPLLCRDGPTPGEPCWEDADCGAGGVCDGSFVEARDEILIEGFLHGWDDDLDVGECNLSPAFPSCAPDDPCRGKHCQGDLHTCEVPANCSPPQACVPNECLVDPLCGSYQWTIFSDSFLSKTNPNPNGRLREAWIQCDTDADCRHGRDLGGSTFQCTCGASKCQSTGICDWTGGAYIDKIRADYLYRELAGGVVTADTAKWSDRVIYIGQTSEGIQDPQQGEYVGTLWLYVQPQSAGTFKLHLDPGENHTFVTSDYGIRLPGTKVVDLQIEVFNPCEDFDLPACLDSEGLVPDPCNSGICFVNDGVPGCTLLQVTCVTEGQCCVADEGGCVECRACCPPVETDPCRVDSELECDTSGGEWLNIHLACVDDGRDVCREPPVCPGPVDWATSVPPTGVLDARQARDVTSGEKQGIDLIVVTGDPDAHDRCFEFCEADREGLPNSIEWVDEDPPGTYAIKLKRRITPGARTIITYDALGNNMSVGKFDSLPADVDASETADGADIIEMVDCCLNQDCEPAYGEYSCDLDRSGGVSGADLLRVIDLLHGAGEFRRAWDGEQLIWGFPCE